MEPWNPKITFKQGHLLLYTCAGCNLQVERMVQEAERNAEADKKRREVIDLKNQVNCEMHSSLYDKARGLNHQPLPTVCGWQS